MKRNLTELVFILDRSGSMAHLVDDTIGGFNAMLSRQKDGEGEALVTTVLVDCVNETIHDRLPITEVPRLTRKEYYVRGCTALLDAVGMTVEHIAGIHKYAREEDRPTRTLFVITTDGYENASHHFSYDKLKRLITEKQEAGWEFIFLGANIDAAKEAARFGIREENAVDYHADSKGTEAVYCAVDAAVSQARCCAPMGRGWRKKLDQDYKSRKG